MSNIVNSNNFLMSQISFFENLNVSIEEIAKEKIKQKLETKDNELRQKYCNGSYGYSIHCKRKIKIITEWGHVEINRTIFKYLNTKTRKYSYVALLDKEIGRKPYERVCFDLRLKILNELASGKRGKDIQDKFKFAKISLMTISNIIRKTDLSKYFSNFLKKQNKIKFDSEYLYVGVDDTFINVFTSNKKLKKVKVRVAFAHTGLDKTRTTKNHHYLNNKRIFLDISYNSQNSKKTTNDYLIKLKKFLNNNYDLTNKKILLMGDGAKWIKDISLNLNAKFSLDEFHLKHLLKNLFFFRRDSNVKLTADEVKRKCIYLDLCNLLKNYSKDDINHYLNTICHKDNLEKNLFLKHKYADIIKFNQYVQNNWKGIKIHQEKFYMGSCTEAQVSHNVKSLFGFGAKAYSCESLNNMLIMKMAKVNRWNILDNLINNYYAELQIEKRIFM